MKKFIVIVGLPCSGKSTYVKENYPNATVISFDNTIQEMYPELSYNEAHKKVNLEEAEKTMKSRLLDAIKKADNDIIVDKTNLKIKSRRKLLASVSKKKFTTIAVVFSLSETEFIKRNELRNKQEDKFISFKTFKEMRDMYEEVTKEEGFDEIYYKN